MAQTSTEIYANAHGNMPPGKQSKTWQRRSREINGESTNNVPSHELAYFPPAFSRENMPMCGVACNPNHWHTFPLLLWAMWPRQLRGNYANACDGTLLCASTIDFSTSFFLPGFTFPGRHAAMCIGIDFCTCLGHVSLVSLFVWPCVSQHPQAST